MRAKVILHIDTRREFGRGIVSGIAKYSHRYGPWVFYQENFELKKSLSLLKKWGANGIVVHVPDPIMAKKVIPSGMPAVAITVNELVKGVPNIMGNAIAIGEMGANYLIDRGFRQFAYCGFSDMLYSQKRAASFCATVNRAGFETHYYERPQLLIRTSWQDEELRMAKWLKSLPKATGLMACNDDCGRYVIECCELAGLHIPDDIAVLGVDNDTMVCDLTTPALSSIVLSLERAGYDAAELLDKLMKNKKVEKNHHIVFSPLYVETRVSTDIYHIEDPEIIEGIRYIANNSRKSIIVDDVAKAVAISRRSLERRFRNKLGHSVNDQIKHQRVEQVIRMLLDTTLSISQIAYALDFEGSNNLARYFRQVKGMTPMEYRKKCGQK